MIWHVLYMYHFMLNKSCLSLSLSLNGEASFLLFLECYTTNFPYQRYDLITLNTIYFISPFWCIAMFLLKIWNIRQYRPVCLADKVRYVNKSIVDWPLTHVVNLIMGMIKRISLQWSQPLCAPVKAWEVFGNNLVCDILGANEMLFIRGDILLFGRYPVSKRVVGSVIARLLHLLWFVILKNTSYLEILVLKYNCSVYNGIQNLGDNTR